MKKLLFILALALGSSSFLVAAPPGGGPCLGCVPTITVAGINGASYSTSTFRGTVSAYYQMSNGIVAITFTAYQLMPNGQWSNQNSASSTATMQGTINGVNVSGTATGPNFLWMHSSSRAPKGQVAIFYQGVNYVIDIDIKY